MDGFRDALDRGLRPSSGEWQWSTAALTRDESDEAERDEEKDRKKDKRRKKKKEEPTKSANDGRRPFQDASHRFTLR